MLVILLNILRYTIHQTMIQYSFCIEKKKFIYLSHLFVCEKLLLMCYRYGSSVQILQVAS